MTVLPLVGREREVGVLDDLVDRVGHAGAAGGAGRGRDWETIPCWYLVGTDNVIPPAQQRVMAERAGCRTAEVKARHLSMLSRPGPVTDLVKKAVRSVR